MNKILLCVLIAIVLYLLFTNINNQSPKIQTGGIQKNVLDIEKVTNLLNKFNI